MKEGVFDPTISKKISSTFNMREKADYEDFFIAYAEDAQIQIEKAEEILRTIEEYLCNKWTND